MAVNLIEKLLSEAVQTGGTYAEFVVSENKIAFICDGGSRRSTRNYRQTKAEMKADELTLRKISEKSLLFSSQLKRIKVTFSSGRTAVFHKTEHDNITTITARKANEIKEKSFDYVCFTSDSSPNTGVAFALKQLKNGRYQITPCAGAIMNGPNITDIPTDLQFVISCSFSLKCGSPDFNACEADQEAAENLSVIMEYALKRILPLGLSGMALFSVLPNSMDEDSFINTKLIQAIKNVCNGYPVFKNREGMIVNRSKIAFGIEEVTKLFPQEIAEPVLGNRYWIEPCKAGSREECFLKDIGITYYDRNRFLKELFRKENLNDCGRIMKVQNDRWVRSFYIFCSGPLDDETAKSLIISGLKYIPSIRDSKGNMQYPDDVSLVTNVEVVGNKAVIVKPDLISPAGVDDEYSTQIRDFFLNDLRIKEYTQKPEMEALAQSMMSKRQSIDRIYAGKLLSLAQFDEAYPGEIDFSSYAIFPFESSRGISRANAEKLIIGKPFVREGNLLASATKRNPIWKGLKTLLSKEDLEAVLAFAERCGAIGLPRITKQKARKHRDFSTILFEEGRQGPRDTDYDYTIPR